MNSRQLKKALIIIFHLLFITTPFFFTWVNEELFEFPKMLLTYGFTIIIAGLWITRMIVGKKIILRQTVFDWPILLFLISQTLSTIFSIHPQTSIMGYYTRFHGGLLSTLSYIVLFYALVSNFSKTELKKLWLTILVSAFGVSLYAIPEHFGHSLSCLIITKKFNVSCWVQDLQNRVFATFGQPNWLAAYAITLIPMSIVFINTKKRIVIQIFTAVTTLALLTTLIFTQSRSGMLGFIASLVIFWVGVLYLKIKNRAQPKWLLKSLGLTAGMGLIIALFGSSFTPSLSQLLTPPAETTAISTPSAEPVVNRLEVGGTDSGEIRRIVWQGAIDVWKRYPILGAGVETFAYSYYQDRPAAHNLVSEWDFLYNKAHNELLNFLANSGLIGLLSYLLLLGWFGIVIIKNLIKPNKQLKSEEQLMLLALLSGVIALSISNFFGFSTVVVSILLFTSLSSVAILVAPAHKTKAAAASAIKLKSGQVISLAGTSLVVFILLSQVLRVWKADYTYALGKNYIEASYVTEGLENLQAAIKLRPKEALYHSQLARSYSLIALALNQQQQSTAAAEFKQAALEEATTTLKLNPRHLSFYKLYAKVLIELSPLDPQLLTKARDVLLIAIDLAPTDAKLLYNLGLIELSLEQTEAGVTTLKKSLELKPNYEAARVALGKQYELLDKADQALEQYRYIIEHITKDNQAVNQKIMELNQD